MAQNSTWECVKIWRNEIVSTSGNIGLNFPKSTSNISIPDARVVKRVKAQWMQLKMVTPHVFVLAPSLSTNHLLCALHHWSNYASLYTCVCFSRGLLLLLTNRKKKERNKKIGLKRRVLLALQVECVFGNMDTWHG